MKITENGNISGKKEFWAKFTDDTIDRIAEKVEGTITVPTPYISDDGYWVIWDSETKEYVKTVVKASGESSGSSVFIVNISLATDGKVTADKTYTDIFNAHSEGKIVQGRITGRGLVGIVTACGTAQALFIIQGNDGTTLIHCSADNVWTSERYEIEYAQKTYVDNSIQSAILDSWVEVTEPIESGVSE